MHALVLDILAAAGGGSGGFGGGGGGGGSFGGGGSGGSGGGASWPAVLFIVAIAVLFVGLGAWSAYRYRRRREARVTRVRLAAAEAATDDTDFDAATVEREAATLFGEVQRRWTARDRAGLRELVGPELLVEWERRLDDFDRKGWHNIAEVGQAPAVEYVGLVNRDGEAEDRVVVRLSCTMQDYVRDGDRVIFQDGAKSKTVHLAQYWTLCPPGDRWRVLAIEADKEGRHHLDAEVVATPWADGRVADEALVETAVADAVPAGVAVAELADPDLADDARAAALDLALVDARFSPDVLAAAVRRAVAAWAEAVDGDDAPLEAVASAAAVTQLLYGGDASGRTRVVVRGARVEAVWIVGLEAEPTPARLTAEVQVRGRRYVEDRDTADVLAGSASSDRTSTQRWTFALDGDAVAPWRLVGVAE